MQLFGGPIIQKAARQATVTTLTTEAKLLALEHVAKESAALKRFLYKLRLDLRAAQGIFYNNQQIIQLVIEESKQITTKLCYIDIQNMWLKQEHAKGSFTVKYLLTSEMLVDRLTKALLRQAYKHFLAYLNLYNSIEQNLQ